MPSFGDTRLMSINSCCSATSRAPCRAHRQNRGESGAEVRPCATRTPRRRSVFAAMIGAFDQAGAELRTANRSRGAAATVRAGGAYSSIPMITVSRRELDRRAASRRFFRRHALADVVVGSLEMRCSPPAFHTRSFGGEPFRETIRGRVHAVVAIAWRSHRKFSRDGPVEIVHA